MIKPNRDWSILDPDFREKVKLWLEDVNKNTWSKIFITEGWRSQERHDGLWAIGRTINWKKTKWPKVTRTRRSKHLVWLAVDIAFKGKELYPSSNSTRETIWLIANKYGIDRGYDLRKRDKPHFQNNNKDLNDVYKPKLPLTRVEKFVYPLLLSGNSNKRNKSLNKEEKKLLHNLSNSIREYLDFYN